MLFSSVTSVLVSRTKILIDSLNSLRCPHLTEKMENRLSNIHKFLGKSLIGKEKAIQTASKEDLKPVPDPVFFISLVGVNTTGFVDKYEHIFDIYTKEYDFRGSNVKVISAQDLRNFYTKHHKLDTFRNFFRRKAQIKKVDVYTMAEFFVEQHSNGHFVVDECLFKTGDSSK